MSASSFRIRRIDILCTSVTYGCTCHAREIGPRHDNQLRFIHAAAGRTSASRRGCGHDTRLNLDDSESSKTLLVPSKEVAAVMARTSRCLS